jgi:UDP-glucose 4-epimerase
VVKCLVTGAAGFIGAHLVERLLDLGHYVIGIDAFTDYYPRDIKEKNLASIRCRPSFAFVEGDILTVDLQDLLQGVVYIFHHAAQAGVRASWGQNFEVYLRNNVLATQKLLEAAKGSPGIRRFIYASSSSVYGSVATLPMRETDQPQPISPYGVTKLAGEHLCQLYWKSFGVPVTILRYFTAYGPRQRPDMALSKFISAALHHESLTVYGDGEQTRDFTYVSDIVAANILAMEKDTVGELFNIGGGTRISVNQLIGKLEETLGEKVEVTYVATQRGDVMGTHADIEKAERLLGYHPTVKIEDGLRAQLDWAKEMLVSPSRSP